jgi:hypothetical protein
LKSVNPNWKIFFSKIQFRFGSGNFFEGRAISGGDIRKKTFRQVKVEKKTWPIKLSIEKKVQVSGFSLASHNQNFSVQLYC